MPDNNNISLSVTGLKEYTEALKRVSEDVAAKAIVNGAYSATKPIIDKASATVPKDTGLLSQSITRKKLIYAKQGTVVIVAGAGSKTEGLDRWGKKRKPYKYVHIVERRTNFMVQAIASTAQSCIKRFESYLKRKLKKYST